MEPEISAELDTLIQDLRGRFPGLSTTVHRLGSGEVWVDLLWKGKFYLLECWPQGNFGVTRMTAEKSFLRGSDHVFNELQEAEAFLIQALEEC